MKRPATVLVVLAALTAQATPALSATRIADPARFVSEVYAKIAGHANTSYIEPEDIYTPRLEALWAGERRDAGGEVGRIDFDFWINGQDGAPSKVQVKTVPVEGRPDRRIVVVRFKFADEPKKAETLQFYFEREQALWKLDDVVSLTPDDPWTLSVILKYGWAG